MSSVQTVECFNLRWIDTARKKYICMYSCASIQVKIYVCVGGEKIHVTFSQMECVYSHHNAGLAYTCVTNSVS